MCVCVCVCAFVCGASVYVPHLFDYMCMDVQLELSLSCAICGPEGA